ncbi:MAG: hypothetical protein HN570_09030 [Verrucomicrobia bacterium]|jgi:photosystem II stability/assembly factor-like uncharacterized protein|nr:hypothetical protein [Verrucomicrobiota bacterium]MDA7515975.1 hypothetical protein [Akkermansiaceae bacterium]MDA7516603.1 hypothetical protein [bacterium]MDA7607769.1 hypothetical protein [Akkermansiaceae bacterium]MDB2640696.1 hypothetical protein [Akkermansiaceae bacterium]
MQNNPSTKPRHPRWTTLLLIAATISLLPAFLRATELTPVTDSLLKRATAQDEKEIWPGGCAGVVTNRLTGDVTVKVVGHGLWRSADQGKTWARLDKKVVSGRDETGWATNVDQNSPTRLASFSLDGTAGWTTDGTEWKKFADLGRNWDYGSVDWGAKNPRVIIAVKHETNPPGEVYVTSDGGTAWNQLPIHVLEDRGKPSMVGALGGNVLIYSKGDGIHRSSDLGKTWTEVSKVNPLTRIPVFFKGVHYLGTTKGLLVSKDKGASWQTQGSPVDIWQGPFFGRDQQEMLVVGESGIHQTKDAGATWRRVADLKPNADGFKFTADWFGCYAWDPVNDIIYASSMGNPVFKLALGE